MSEKLREAARQALEAWDDLPSYQKPTALHQRIEALRNALAEPTGKQPLQVEPVAWRYKGDPWFDGDRWHDKFEVTTDRRVAKFRDKDATPLYATPPQRPLLTDEEIKVMWDSHRAALPRYLCFARAVERKVRGEKE